MNRWQREMRRARRAALLAPEWSPLAVALIRSGLCWDPQLGVTNLGAANFNWAEINLHTAADQVQATIAKQPAAITTAGSTQWRLTTAADSRMLSTGNVTAGWSAGLYLGMWLRMPNGTPTVGTTTFFSHQTASNGLRRITCSSNGTTNNITLSLSADGTAVQQDIWALPEDGLWHRHEWILNPGVGCDYYRDLVLITHVTTAINLATLNDPAVPLAIGAATGVAVNQNDHDTGHVEYLPSAPSLADRMRIANWRSPLLPTLLAA